MEKIKYHRNSGLVTVGLLLCATAIANKADVLKVDVSCREERVCNFDVTVQHADAGWEHYANKWEIVTMGGEILATLVLAHPHDDEQPFTRSLQGVKIPIGIETVVVRAGDSVHGLGGEELSVDLPLRVSGQSPSPTSYNGRLQSTPPRQGTQTVTKMSTEPDLSSRPFEISLEFDLESSASAYYAAWTENFDRWFAEPGTLTMSAVEGGLFFFETRFEGQRHPHYGRFLELVPNELIRLTWVTGSPGTNGAETVITVRLTEKDGQTKLTFSHAGFPGEKTRNGHEEAWKYILKHVDQQLASGAI